MFSGVTIHGVQEVILKDEKQLKNEKGGWVRILTVKHDGGTTSIGLFAGNSGQLKVLQR